jgi:hypothetical protein
MSQNISNSSYIFLGWLALGVITFVLYMLYRKHPLWEPLEVPPPPDREVDRRPPEPMPRIARYHVGRRERIAAHAAAEQPHVHRRRRGWRLEWELYFARHGQIRGLLIVAVFAATSLLAVGVDLSPYDPFGPSLQWSPGLVGVALIAAYLLNRSHGEQ